MNEKPFDQTPIKGRKRERRKRERRKGPEKPLLLLRDMEVVRVGS